MISSRNAWTVGYFTPPAARARQRVLIEHWNGRAWTIQASQKPHHEGSVLSGVTATSARNAWAVGYTWDEIARRTAFRTVIERWSGRAWTIQASPKLRGSGDSELLGVAAISSTNAWAVGYDSAGALIEHFNGKAWTIQSSPRVRSGQLVSVAATSSRNAWAVGHYLNAGAYRTLIEHWNGKAWTVQASPSGHVGALQSIAATSIGNAWLAGFDGIQHWDGKAWTIQTAPQPQHEAIALAAVAGTSPRNAWAVGYLARLDVGGPTGTVIEHWNGRAWKVAPSGSVGIGQLSGVAASPTNMWAVGTNYGQALAVHCR